MNYWLEPRVDIRQVKNHRLNKLSLADLSISNLRFRLRDADASKDLIYKTYVLIV